MRRKESCESSLFFYTIPLHTMPLRLASNKKHKNILGISPLGLGTVKFGRNQQIKYPQPFHLPSDKAILELLSIAQDLGMNHIDTAPAYGSSEERIGRLLKDRKLWIISSKTGEIFNNEASPYHFSQYNFTPEFTIESVKNSLKQLKTDYIDIIFVHSDGSDAAIIQQYGTLDALAQLKQQGLIRCYGLSVKNPVAAIQSLPQCEAMMIEYHPNMPLDQQTATEQLLEQALNHHTLVCVKKALISGHLDKISTADQESTQPSDPVETSLRFIFTHPAVTNVTIGSINPQHLMRNVQAFNHAMAD